MSKKATEILVGVFVLLGALSLLFLALKAANLTQGFNASRAGYTLQARFDNIGGLKVRAPVRTAGVVVGRVTAISLDNNTFQGLVTMQIEKGFQFPRDSSAKILTSGLLGDQYLGIEPGGDEKNFAAGDTISRTQSAIVLENLIGQFLFSKAADAGTSSNAAAPGGKK